MAGAACAGEYAVFASGTRLHIDRHQTTGDKLRLYMGAGFTELDPGQVVRFEQEETVAQAPAAQTARKPAVPLSEHALVDAAARRYGLPEDLLHSVVKQESGYRAGAVSPKGAMGLMQLMPGTAKALGADPRDPAQNVDAGARYLAELLRKYNGLVWHALAAYNAGPGALQKHGGDVPPYRETREYIRRIAASWREKR